MNDELQKRASCRNLVSNRHLYRQLDNSKRKFFTRSSPHMILSQLYRIITAQTCVGNDSQVWQLAEHPTSPYPHHSAGATAPARALLFCSKGALTSVNAFESALLAKVSRFLGRARSIVACLDKKRSRCGEKRAKRALRFLCQVANYSRPHRADIDSRYTHTHVHVRSSNATCAIPRDPGLTSRQCTPEIRAIFSSHRLCKFPRMLSASRGGFFPRRRQLERWLLRRESLT